MGKKFFDIKRVEKEEKKEPLSKKRSNKPIIYSLASLLIIILIGFFVYSFTSEIIIEIIPEISSLEFQETVSLDTEIEQSILVEKKLMAQEIELESKSSQEFLSTGRSLEEYKATGVIRVYNEHSADAQPLLSQTRFISSGGKLFRSVQAETIPGGTYQDGELVPGYLDIEVEAAEPGSDYNIGPTSFSIPGFAGTPRYTTFYGKSYENMTGGTTEEKSQVTQEDLNEGEKQLTERLKKRILEELLENVSEGFVLVEPTVQYQVMTVVSSHEPGDIEDSFELEIEVKANGLILKEEDLLNLAKKISSEELRGQVIDSFQAEYEINDQTKIYFSLKTYTDLEILDLKKEIVSLTKTEAKNRLKEMKEIEEVVVKSWPLIRRRVPESLEMIEINLTK